VPVFKILAAVEAGDTPNELLATTMVQHDWLDWLVPTIVSMVSLAA
jgi:hypothetical protein